MPTGAEHPTSMPFQDSQYNWTDDLPVCKQSGVGFSTNQIYREDGYRQEEHPFEDRSFHCRYDDSTFLYGVFDGHEGTKAANFAMQRIAAEILLGQLNGKSTDEEVKEVLRQAFIAVEKGYLESIGDLLAERASLQFDIPDGLNSYETYQKFPDLVDKLNTLNCELSAGTSAVVALVYRGRLFVANVGDSRALLCKTDSNQVLRVVQLSVDHDLRNEDELLRLSQLGLDVESVRQGSHLGNQENTRCLGNYLVKGGYREFEELVSSAAEPIIAEPEIHGSIELDESCRFLLLMSRGLYKSLEEATATDQVNKEMALIAVEQFRVQSTLTGVAQAVVDKIVRIHHDVNMSNTQSTLTTGKRDDITLLVRNFNFPLPHALKSPTSQSVRFNPVVQTAPVRTIPDNEDFSSTGITDDNFDTSTTETSTTTTSDMYPPGARITDRNARIKPYVDFSEYYENVEKRRQEGTLPEGIDF
ncbi:TGF-beta-activated kinase 1 and MAP3K7-binding protein 1 [Harpegnathos saltator]|uniref:TGF-beta-activated kinase 1 and MAP3K7-binding protein 1 n=1 Tax=Harpegnathos saltator TaxID=610380 RepID=E2BNJ6_HARSA|nr:TGF-beta-activated kinase 1 and MAP3K7-binding protein 1 [Harpegnathos saltator]XP_011142249.1 TGF-beta-activated kinase 1 and MAP3K7-binding protein 1 [Harpegnathos saltator]EFN82775.1 Mitogen-activated protein kinase kinase kinase 7-interacting protein 1 [Harpegnathos saltator]